MAIDQNILISYGGVSKIYHKKEVIFNEGDKAKFYHQIISGSIKMININYEGKEFTQGLFKSGECFGEPPLFIDMPYPASAIAAEDSVIIKLSKESLFKVLAAYPELPMDFIKCFSKRIYSKTVSVREIVNSDPEQRIVSFLESLKNEFPGIKERIRITYTRQEIANFTGLRVETVIRALTKMHREKRIEIIDHKLYF